MKADQTSPAGDTTQDAPSGGGLPLARAIGTRNLLIVIFTMPLVFLAVVLAIIVFAGKPAREARAAGEASAAAPVPAPILLPEDGRIVAMNVDGDRLVLRVEHKGGGDIVVYDLAKGRTLRTVPVRTGPQD